MYEISRQRFDILVAYARGPLAPLMGREIAWFETDGGRAVGALMIDTDGEFVGVVLAPDLLERYRAIYLTRFHDSWRGAMDELGEYVSTRLFDAGVQHAQGDESGFPIDFFVPVAAESKWHPIFRQLRTGDAFSAARAVITALMRWHEDVDGNFIEQFQTTGFDARIWELYLFATLPEAGLGIERPKPAPDFVARGIYGEFAIEATTINPRIEGGHLAQSVRPSASGDDQRYHQHYLPIRYAGPLTAKLGKRYWEQSAVAGMPLVFAIQDFHDTMSMSYSGSALPTYLYGWRHEAQRDEDARLVVIPIRVAQHVWGSKVVPSGFFDQPDAENVSAVIFNSLGTLSKFNRMGVQAGFGSGKVVLIHSGATADPDPDADEPLSFSDEVTVDSQELWMDGMDVFHNPNAVHPLNPQLLPHAAHHRLLTSGLIETTAEGGKIISSTTAVIVGRRSGGDNEESA